MSYYSLNKIRTFSETNNPIYENKQREYLSTKTTVFLSHSHKDADIIKDAMAFLLAQGIYVYVDWLDPTMPSITSAETAKKIKDRIRQCDRFVVLLTEKSKNSKWVPWELGYADGQKPIEKIAILPVKRNSSTKDSEFDGLEYMELYPKISIGNNPQRTAPAIFPPNRVEGKGKWLNEGWLDNTKQVTFV